MMRLKAQTILVILPFLIFFTSCVGIYEEITVQADKTGHYQFYMDMVEAKIEANIHSDSVNAINDSTVEIRSYEEIELAVLEEFEESIDSTTNFPEELLSQLELDSLDRLITQEANFFIRGQKADKSFKMGAEYSYSNFQDLVRFTKIVEKILAKNSRRTLQDTNEPTFEMDYELHENTFKRSFRFVKITEVTDEAKMFVNAMYRTFSFSTIINMPRPIKEVKSNHTKKIDGQTVTFEYNLADFINRDANLSFEIIME